MARFGQQVVQGLTRPSFAQGLFDLGSAIGGTPSAVAAERQKQERLKRQQQMAMLEAAGAESTARAKSAREDAIYRRAMQVAEQKRDFNALQALEVKAIDPREYLKSQLKEQEQAKPVSISPGGALVSPTGEVLYERGFKPEPETEPEVSFVKADGDKTVLVFKGTELVNQIEVEGDTDENISSRESVIGTTSNTLTTVREAKNALREAEGTAGGIVGAGASLIPGTTAHELMTSTYVTIAGREALDEINRMKEAAAEFGSRGTGLGQVTQIEFAALQGNLAKLNTGLTVKRQLELLDKIENKLVATRRIASGENPIDVIDFNEPVYIEAGYIKEGGEVYYFSPDGKEFVYDRDRESFVQIGE
jgi:hypothetical protein